MIVKFDRTKVFLTYKSFYSFEQMYLKQSQVYGPKESPKSERMVRFVQVLNECFTKGERMSNRDQEVSFTKIVSFFYFLQMRIL